jgi:putative spermidine/putrescine transport system substrate-binding protein
MPSSDRQQSITDKSTCLPHNIASERSQIAIFLGNKIGRRPFSIGVTSIVLSQILSGCGDREEKLKIFLLQRALPLQLIGEFKKQIAEGKSADFQSKAQLKDLFSLLEFWQKPLPEGQNSWDWIPFLQKKTSDIGDLVSLGDYWLGEAIEKQLIQPLNLQKSSQWQKIPSLWQQSVKRNAKGNFDPNGEIWGAPYRSGMTLIVYDEGKFAKLGWKPQDWGDLWREELAGRFSLLNDPREVIGLTLKKLGHSYNTKDLSKVIDLEAQLQILDDRTKFYDNKDYLQPLILEDTWLAVGWSSDILPLLSKYPNLKAIVPASGTSVWADIWVRPKRGTNAKTENQAAGDDFIAQWIDFCWQPRSANEISLLSHGTSPISLTIDPQELPNNLQNNPLAIFDKETIAKSEFLQPLDKTAKEAYQSLWQKIRSK